MRRTGHTKMMKQVNIGTLLKDIRAWGPISRAELVKTSKLSPTTVSVLVEELLEAGIVREIGTGESSGGRRPILLEFQPDSRLAVGIDLGMHKTTIALLDLNGRTLMSQSYTSDLSSKEVFLHDIVKHTTLFLETTSHLKQNILGMGVATPGLLDQDKKVILYSSSLGFTDVALYDALDQNFPLPIRIDNDMNAAALGEKLMGSGKRLSDVIYVSVEKGIGAGIIINHRIYGGATGSAGEFGHTTVEPAGTPCKCGNKGCLGVMAGEPAFVSRAMHMLSIGVKTKMNDYIKEDLSQISLDIIARAAKEGDPVALTLANDCLDYLAIGIANLINMFDPQAIILGGSTIETLEPLALERVRKTVQKRVLPFHEQRSLTIIPSVLKDRVRIVGASTLIFSEFLDYADVLTTSEEQDKLPDYPVAD